MSDAMEDEKLPLSEVARSIRHHLNNLKQGSNTPRYTSGGPKHATSGYLYAEVPDWTLRQWLDSIDRLTARHPQTQRAK